MRNWRLVPTLILAMLLPLTAFAGNWRVIPIRIDLGKNVRSSVVRLTNSGDQPLRLQVKAFKWLQDEAGEDRYEATEELLFFPRIMTVSPGKEAVLRVGIQKPALEVEKAYRLFIEEIPSKDPNRGSGVTVALRFGLPVFVEPLEEKAATEIAPLSLEQGRLQVQLHNPGNTHFKITAAEVVGLSLAGEEVFRKELKPWYLLSGSSRLYTPEIDAGDCRASDRIVVTVDTDKVDLQKELKVTPGLCPP